MPGIGQLRSLRRSRRFCARSAGQPIRTISRTARRTTRASKAAPAAQPRACGSRPSAAQRPASPPQRSSERLRPMPWQCHSPHHGPTTAPSLAASQPPHGPFRQRPNASSQAGPSGRLPRAPASLRGGQIARRQLGNQRDRMRRRSQQKIALAAAHHRHRATAAEIHSVHDHERKPRRAPRERRAAPKTTDAPSSAEHQATAANELAMRCPGSLLILQRA